MLRDQYPLCVQYHNIWLYRPPDRAVFHNIWSPVSTMSQYPATAISINFKLGKNLWEQSLALPELSFCWQLFPGFGHGSHHGPVAIGSDQLGCLNSLNPTPRIALFVCSFVRSLVTKFQPHYRYMHHTYMHASGSGTRIIDICASYILLLESLCSLVCSYVRNKISAVL